MCGQSMVPFSSNKAITTKTTYRTNIKNPKRRFIFQPNDMIETTRTKSTKREKR